MRTELLIFLIVAIVAAIPLISIEKTGMQTVTVFDYPEMFYTQGEFNAYIVSGVDINPSETSAIDIVLTRMPDLIRMSKGHSPSDYFVLHTFPEALRNSVYREDEIDFREKNGIIIGTPCSNTAVAELLGIFDCTSHFKPKEGLIKIMKAYNNTYLVITGYDSRQVFDASIFFMDYVQQRKIQRRHIYAMEMLDYEIPLRYGRPIIKY